MADRLAELGTRFRRARNRQIKIKADLKAVTEEREELRRELRTVIAEALSNGRTITEVTKLTGYTRDAVLRIRKAVEQSTKSA